MSAAASRILAGRYRLDAPLGAGGMGEVYRGFDLAIERPVAVKILRRDAGAAPGDAARFLREVRATASVRDPHCVTVHDVGETEDGDPYLVLELVEGESLDVILGREGALGADRAVRIATQICEALAAAHAAGIVHRDIKPANVVVSKDDFVKVLDFGIAKRVDQRTALTEAGMVVGTLAYAAPEQIAGEAVDGRTDQYALAATIIRMIAGESLFPDTSVASVVHHHLLKEPTPLRERVPSTPPALDAALRRALAKKPADRFPDIAAFAAALAPGEGAARAAETPSPAARRSGEIDLDVGAGDVALELAAPRAGGARPAAFVPVVRAPPPASPTPSSLAPPAFDWLSPAVWKRVAAYSAVAILLGNAFIAGFSTTSTVLLACAVALGAAALVYRARRDRTRP